MSSMNRHQGSIVALHRDHLDNNDIIPSFFAQKTLKKHSGKYLFNNIRYLPGLPKKADPAFPLNKPEYQEATILIPGAYFATEIAYEEAVWAILDSGFKVIISNEFGHDFKMNSYRNRLIAIALPLEQVEILAEAAVGEHVLVDLEAQEVRYQAYIFPFEMDPDVKEYLMHGLDNVNETLQYDEAIATYEARWDNFYESEE